MGKYFTQGFFIMVKNLQAQIQKIQKFKKDRIIWLRLSVIVLIAIAVLIIDIAFIDNQKLHYLLVSCGLIISAAWWYWTMKLVRELIDHKLLEVELLAEIIDDIKSIKNNLKNIDHTP